MKRRANSRKREVILSRPRSVPADTSKPALRISVAMDRSPHKEKGRMLLRLTRPACGKAWMAVLILAASLTGSALAQPTAPAFVPREESPEEFPAGPGRDETFYACTACHNFKLVAAQGLSRERWDDSISWMTQRHNMPPLEGAERKVVLDYLAATYPPRAPSRAGGWQSPFAPR
jgi:hypothetical protein